MPNGDLIATAVIVVMLLSYAYDVPTNPSAPSFRSPDWTVSESDNQRAASFAGPFLCDRKSDGFSIIAYRAMRSLSRNLGSLSVLGGWSAIRQ
jgi:hypothetical protein